MSLIRTLIADDHPLVLRGLRDFLSTASDIEVVACCSDGAQALQGIRQLKPDVAILDLSMPRLNGLEILSAMRIDSLPTRALMLSGVVGTRAVMTAMAEGAYGFLLKESDPDEVLKSIREIAAGHKCIPFELVDQTIANRSTHDRIPLEKILTQREWKVMVLAAQGLSNKDIARQLNVSEGTAKIHLHHIFRKMGVKNRTALANMAIEPKSIER